MNKAKTPQDNINHEPAAQTSARGESELAQRDGSLQLKSIANSSPVTLEQRKKSDSIQNSHLVAAQRKFIDGSEKLNSQKKIATHTSATQNVISPASIGPTIQRRVTWDAAETRNRYKPDRNENINSSLYINQYDRLNAIEPSVKVIESTSVSQGEGAYENTGGMLGPMVRVHPLEGEANDDNQHFNDNISTLGHEFQHAMDDLSSDRIDAFNHDVGSGKRWNIIHTEWRAWAVQAAINFEQSLGKTDEDVKLHGHHKRMLRSFLSPDGMVLVSDEFFRKTLVYINKHVLKDTDTEFSESQAQAWMQGEQGSVWLAEAVAIFEANTSSLTEEDAIASGLAEEATSTSTLSSEIVTINESEELDTLAPGLKTAGSEVQKIRKEGSFYIYGFEGRQFKIANTVVAEGFFDSAQGVWAAQEVQAEEPAEDSPITIEVSSELDQLAPGLRTGGSEVSRVRRMDGYKIYSFGGKLYKVANAVVADGYFDSCSGAWEN